MICGSGIDIVKNERLKEAVEKWGERFLKRIFTDHELDYCMSRTWPYPCLAARFAAKEAFIKAAGGMVGFTFIDIEVLNDKSGRPYLNLHNGAGECMKRLSVMNHILSVSHEREFSVALVLFEK